MRDSQESLEHIPYGKLHATTYFLEKTLKDQWIPQAFCDASRRIATK
jgi:hypothetical protein